jgi:hypothetical protein
MRRWAAKHGKLFVPSVGPGYQVEQYARVLVLCWCCAGFGLAMFVAAAAGHACCCCAARTRIRQMACDSVRMPSPYCAQAERFQQPLAPVQDTKIRPWNAQATRAREGGQRYSRYWEKALNASAEVVSITSYNEWGEGTQASVAARGTVKGCTLGPRAQPCGLGPWPFSAAMWPFFLSLGLKLVKLVLVQLFNSLLTASLAPALPSPFLASMRLPACAADRAGASLHPSQP